MSGEINLNIDDIAISESVRPYVRKIDSQEQFRLPNPEEIPDAINYSVKKCIDSASFIPWESVLKKDYIFEDDDVSGLVCFKIPEDIQLIPLFEKEMFRQLYELQQSKNRVVDGMTLMGLDPNLNRKIRNNLQDNDNDEIRGETILDHELKHAFSYTGDERAKYISLRLSQALMPNGETVIFLSKAQVDLYDDLIVADIESLIAPHHPSISDLAAAKLLAEKALASLSYDAVDNHRLLKQILDNIQNNFMSHEDASEEIFGLWARLYREEKTK